MEKYKLMGKVVKVSNTVMKYNSDYISYNSDYISYVEFIRKMLGMKLSMLRGFVR